MAGPTLAETAARIDRVRAALRPAPTDHIAAIARHTASFPAPTLRRSDDHLFMEGR